MRVRSFALVAVVLGSVVISGCDGAKEAVVEANDDRKQLIDDVGHAPKRQIDKATAIIEEAAENMNAKAHAAEQVVDDQ